MSQPTSTSRRGALAESERAPTPAEHGPDGHNHDTEHDEAEVDLGLVPASEADVSEPGSLKDRFFRPRTLISFVIAGAIAAFFILRLDIDPAEVWANARNTNPWLYALAFASFYLGFILRAQRWRVMLARAGIDEAHGYHIPRLPGLIEIYLISWFANCIVPAKLGDAYRSYLFKKESGASFSTTLGTILSERLLDLIALFIAMVGAAVIVFGTRLPGEATQTVVGGSILLALGAAGLGAMWFSRATIERRLPDRLREQYVRLHGAVFSSLRRPQRFLGVGFVIWLSEGLRLYLVCLALDAGVSFSTAVFVALLASLLTALPFTPAGLGVVEGGMTLILGVVGVDPALALSITLLDRVIGYWSVIVVGFTLYLLRTRRELRVATARRVNAMAR